MNIPKEDLAILNAAAPYINANLFNASDLVEIYQRELARSSDIDIEVEKVKVLSQIFLHFILGETVFTDSVTILLILTVLVGKPWLRVLKKSNLVGWDFCDFVYSILFQIPSDMIVKPT